MNSPARTIAELRVLIGYLGEKSQDNWWASDFFSQSATAFLSPIFNRTLFLAQYHGVTAGAAKVHDEAIGVGRIYHLFRLPIGLEQAAANTLQDPDFLQYLQVKIATREMALARLKELACVPAPTSPGPVSLGLQNQDPETDLLKSASMYFSAFISGFRTFPYVREVE